MFDQNNIPIEIHFHKKDLGQPGNEKNKSFPQLRKQDPSHFYPNYSTSLVSTPKRHTF